MMLVFIFIIVIFIIVDCLQEILFLSNVQNILWTLIFADRMYIYVHVPRQGFFGVREASQPFIVYGFLHCVLVIRVWNLFGRIVDHRVK